jgi:GGDEF domain-containing protein
MVYIQAKQKEVTTMTYLLRSTENDLDLIQAIIERDMKIAALEAQIEELKICPIFNVYTRQGLDTIDTSGASHVVFLDFDNMKAANSKFGYREVDKKIKNIFSHTREGDVIPVRWYSGDEFILIGD